MLSKLSMAVFAPLAFAYGVLSPRHRERLQGWRPYLGLCLGLAFTLPLVAWNLENDWRAFRHVAHQGGVTNAAWFVPRYFGDYLLGQLALLSPIVFLLFLTVLGRGRRLWRNAAGPWMDRYLWITAMPVFLLFALLSTHTRVEGNWPAFGYFGACILMAAGYHGRRVWVWALGTAGAMSLMALVQVVHPFVPLPSKADRIAQEFGDWQRVGEAVNQIKATLPGEPFIFALNYQMASKLAFYTPGKPLTVALNRGKRPNTYDYWWADAALMGRDAVGVTKYPDQTETRLAPFFDAVDPPVAVTLWDHRKGKNGQPKPVRRLYLYRARGFKGGHRWVPRSADDIRVSAAKTGGSSSPKDR
jgi:undecaprenyl-diphosphatase